MRMRTITTTGQMRTVRGGAVETAWSPGDSHPAPGATREVELMGNRASSARRLGRTPAPHQENARGRGYRWGPGYTDDTADSRRVVVCLGYYWS
jgi:hypothetical protein